MTPEERLEIRRVGCRTCGSQMGEPCRTPKGKALSRPHAARVRYYQLQAEHPQR